MVSRSAIDSIALCVLLALFGCKRSSDGRDTPAGSIADKPPGLPVAEPTGLLQQQKEAASERLTLPGWEDLLVGEPLPGDARQTCTDKDGGTQLPDHEKICKGCRSAQLPTPCVEVMTLDGVHAAVISAKLPDDEQVAKAVEALHTRWGAATSRDGTAGQLEWEEWSAQHESVMLATNFLDMSDCSDQDIKNNAKCGRVSKRPHARVVTISSPTAQTKPADATSATDGTGNSDGQVGGQVSASSNTDAAAQLFDGDLSTGWTASSSDKEPWIEIEFHHPLMLTAVSIGNGLQATDKSGDEFTLNSRIKDGRLRLSDNTERTIHFEADERDFITFTVPPKSTSSLRIIVDTTYPGTRLKEVAISEIRVSADDNHGTPATTPSTTSHDDQRAKDQRCAQLADKWCTAERQQYGSQLMMQHQQSGLCDSYGNCAAANAAMPDTFDDRSCRNRLTKLCQRGRARFKQRPGGDQQSIWSWCVDVDDMDEWHCH
jgi:hypothetical protein